MILPPEAIPVLAELAPAFTQPTYRRFVSLLLAAVLTTGRHADFVEIVRGSGFTSLLGDLPRLPDFGRPDGLYRAR